MEGRIFYITKSKLKELKGEYNELLKKEHDKAVDHEAPKMLESEDLNPEFVSFKEDVASLRSRIDELKNIIDHHELIKSPAKTKASFVSLGAKVKVDVNGKKKDEFVILGTLEANPDEGIISNESPVGKALLGKKVGEEIMVEHPIKAKYKIRNIKYEAS